MPGDLFVGFRYSLRVRFLSLERCFALGNTRVNPEVAMVGNLRLFRVASNLGGVASTAKVGRLRNSYYNVCFIRPDSYSGQIQRSNAAIETNTGGLNGILRTLHVPGQCTPHDHS